MPSRMKFRATKFRTPSHCVVWSRAARRSSKENVLGSDFTSQYRRSPGARGVNTWAHAPPSCFTAGCFGADFLAPAAAFFRAAGFATFLSAFFLLVPVDFEP